MTDKTEQPTHKPSKPDYEINIVTEENGKSYWQKTGAVWDNGNGYLTGKIGDQSVVLQSREAKEALMKMRAEKQAVPTELKQEQTQTPSI